MFSKNSVLYLIFFLFLGIICSYAQNGERAYKGPLKKASQASARGKTKIPCPAFADKGYPYHGLGIKVGDPFAFTYKYYASEHLSFAADFGKSAKGLYNRYYRSIFNESLPDSLGNGDSTSYLGHTVKANWFLEAKALYQWDARKISPGLQLYVGFGWQLRNAQLKYDYLSSIQALKSEFGKFPKKLFTQGPVAIVGFEYAYPYSVLPLSAFIEIEWFLDALADPGVTRFQGGAGLRYIF